MTRSPQSAAQFKARQHLQACVADKLNPGIVHQQPKACSVSRVLPGFSLIGSNWLLWLRSQWIPDTQNKHGGVDTELPVEANLKLISSPYFAVSVL